MASVWDAGGEELRELQGAGWTRSEDPQFWRGSP
jgi:hypothetical protein